MPRCVECQADVPRDEMRGAADDLRCAACAARYAEIYYAPRQPSSRPLPPLVTIALCVAAVVVTWACRRHAVI